MMTLNGRRALLRKSITTLKAELRTTTAVIVALVAEIETTDLLAVPRFAIARLDGLEKSAAEQTDRIWLLKKALRAL